MPAPQRLPAATVLMALVLTFTLACSDSNEPDPPETSVATVSVTPADNSVLAGETVQLSAVALDAAGDPVAGQTFAWTTSNGAVATVSNTGLVTTLAPGTVQVSATAAGKSGAVAVESVDPARIPAFIAPFDVDFEVRTTNYHDHDEPREFVDDNGRYIPWWGESSTLGIDGHEGYDWQLPVGTPIRAVAAGTVTAAVMEGQAFFCPILDATVSNSVVRIEHELPGGVRVESRYVHLSRIDVTSGAQVAEGQQIGLSGDKGCALAPHLHFQVDRLTQVAAGPSPIDPYGWDGPAADPWESNANGAASIDLWKAGEAPTLFRSVVIEPNPDPDLAPFVIITRLRFQGVRDEANPNNEYVEVTRDARVAPSTLDISGFTLTTKAGSVYTFPAGTVLSDANPSVRVFSGGGTETASALFRGLAAGVYDNVSECVTFANAVGAVRNRAGWGGGCL